MQVVISIITVVVITGKETGCKCCDNGRETDAMVAVASRVKLTAVHVA